MSSTYRSGSSDSAWREHARTVRDGHDTIVGQLQIALDQLQQTRIVVSDEYGLLLGGHWHPSLPFRMGQALAADDHSGRLLP